MSKKIAAPESGTIKQHSHSITSRYRIEISTTEVVTVEIEADTEANALDALRYGFPGLELFDSHYLEPEYRMIYSCPLRRSERGCSDGDGKQ
jgi:hypothetical protein